MQSRCNTLLSFLLKKQTNQHTDNREDSEDKDRNSVSDSIAKDNIEHQQIQESFDNREAAINKEEPKLTFTPPHQKRVKDKIKMFELSPSVCLNHLIRIMFCT